MSLPSAQPLQITPELTIQAPLTRRGTGPGLILVVPPKWVIEHMNKLFLEYVQIKDTKEQNHEQKTLDPEPRKKWAEEGYAVAQITVGDDRASREKFPELFERAMRELGGMKECEGVGKVGVVVYGSISLPSLAPAIVALSAHIVSVIFYGPFNPQWATSISPIPILAHIPGPAPKPSSIALFGPEPTNLKSYHYPSLKTLDCSFALPQCASFGFNPSASSLSHTRSLTFLKPLIGGPFFDLESIWDEHTRYEFADRSVENTMLTMVDEPYVNHVPTLTGGIGRASLTRFYRDHFIHSNADDARLELVSRTVGVDRVVDEFLFAFTHVRVVDWLIPGIPPTHRKVRIPFTSIVNIRGDRLYHEHIAWDQGTVLRQLGLLPEYLPFPYALPSDSADGRQEQSEERGKRYEYRVPVAGIETAEKLVDENAVESNAMLGYKVREVS